MASLVMARETCSQTNKAEWQQRHEERLIMLARDHLPSGSGFDRGTMIDLDRSDANKLVFVTFFHHMTEHGYYDRWTEHTVTVRPSLAFGFHLSISGRDRNQIKDYIADSFQHALDAEEPQQEPASADLRGEP
jgi:hypothetical protein